MAVDAAEELMKNKKFILCWEHTCLGSSNRRLHCEDTKSQTELNEKLMMT